MVKVRQQGVAILMLVAVSVAVILVFSAPRAEGVPLELTVTTDKDSYSVNEKILAAIKLKNVSGAPVVIPKLDPSNIRRTYIRLEILHESGVTIHFVRFSSGDLPVLGARANNTQVLQPGEELFFTEILNEGGLGPFGFPTPQAPGSFQFFSGRFEVTAKFIVDADNLPTAGDAAVFRGTITSADPETITIVGIPVNVDIKPGSDSNPINPRSKDVIPVTILATAAFDATTVDPLSVRFGPSGATESHNRGHIEDVDSDGDLDLVLHFNVQDTGIVCGATSAFLTGHTFAGQPIQGTDSIVTVGCK